MLSTAGTGAGHPNVGDHELGVKSNDPPEFCGPENTRGRNLVEIIQCQTLFDV